jgi:hypothetical protein
MKTAEDIESYLIQIDTPFERVGDGVWLLKEIGPEMVISIADSILAFRLKLMDANTVPAAKREQLYHTLLKLNASEMLHGAYGLENGAVVICAALQLENLDINELQATIDDIGMAASNHYSTLSKFSVTI